MFFYRSIRRFSARALILLAATVLSLLLAENLWATPPGEDLGTASTAFDAETAVGVIPGPEGCPRGTATVIFIMRNQRTDNNNFILGWTGAIQQKASSTYWVFCRVDGTRFRSLEIPEGECTSFCKEWDYAVLQLGNQCPEGARIFSRHFHNDFRPLGPINNVYGDHGPNHWLPNTHLNFCFFPGTSSEDDITRPTMERFPGLRFEYGVFAPSQLELALATGHIHTDDVNADNQNFMTFGPGVPNWVAEGIVSDTEGFTDIHVAQVSDFKTTSPDTETCGDVGFCVEHPRPIDLTISITHTITTETQRTEYEDAISHFADAIYEMSNGLHKVRNVHIYHEEEEIDIADVVWSSAEGRANARANGYYSDGQVRMFNITDPQASGYTLGHEWGHYYYSLLDEYRESTNEDKNKYPSSPHTTDLEVVPSVMNCQGFATNRRCLGSNLTVITATTVFSPLDWLNFSIESNNTRRNAQHRIYEAAGWTTLARDPALDPRDREIGYERVCETWGIGGICGKSRKEERISWHTRLAREHYPELATVRPLHGLSLLPILPVHMLAAEDDDNPARSLLDMIWYIEEQANPEPILSVFESEDQISNNNKVTFPVGSNSGAVEVIVAPIGDSKPHTIVLRDPNNQVRDEQTCSPAENALTPCSVSASLPDSGLWELEVLVNEPPLSYGYVIIEYPRVAGGYAYRAWVDSALGSPLVYPEPGVVMAQVSRELPITGAGVTAHVQWPDGSERTLALRDDGVSPDKYAGDGLYTGFLSYDQNGEYSIHVRFDNDAGTAEFTTVGLQHGDRESYPVGENFLRTAMTTIVVEDFRQDDHGNTPDEATVLAADNREIPGRIDYAGDVDVFSVTPNESGELVARLVGMSLDMQPIIRILDTDKMTVLATVEAPPEPDYPFVTIQAEAGETFYIEVFHMDANATTGLYHVGVGASLNNGSEAGPRTDPEILISLILEVDSGDDWMQLDWNLSNDPQVTNYRVLRSTDDARNMQIIADSQTEITYLDQRGPSNPLSEQTTYCYRVDAMTGPNTVSSLSNLACSVLGLLDPNPDPDPDPNPDPDPDPSPDPDPDPSPDPDPDPSPDPGSNRLYVPALQN